MRKPHQIDCGRRHNPEDPYPLVQVWVVPGSPGVLLTITMRRRRLDDSLNIVFDLHIFPIPVLNSMESLISGYTIHSSELRIMTPIGITALNGFT